jgi:pimeloyl-ACP methyl ester carboxylesterase
VRIDNAGVEIEVADGGTGTPVLLLHGFPDSGRMWRNQVSALQDAGFRTIVPDLRGFGESDAPDDPGAYAMPLLASDVLAVLDHLGVARAHVVGHDWGAALAWAIASLAPDRVDHLVALSVGNPQAFSRAGMDQRERSWYMLLFQFAGIAEQWLSMDGWVNFRAWCDHPDHDEVVARLERPGRLTASLNWYRANVPPEGLVGPPLELPPVAAPTMGVWSSGDRHLLEQQMEGSARYVTGTWRYERLDGPGHWLTLEAPAELNRLLLDFLPLTD